MAEVVRGGGEVVRGPFSRRGFVGTLAQVVLVGMWESLRR